MNNINIKELVNDSVNIVELYFVNKKLDNNVINVMMSRDIENKIDKLYKKTKEENYKMYYMKDKVYTYELSNDNQYVTSKTKKLDTFYKTKKSNIYIISSKIDKYPQYVFPCTNDIDNISEINIKEYKISNRVSLIIKNEVIYEPNGPHIFHTSKKRVNEYVNNFGMKRKYKHEINPAKTGTLVRKRKVYCN